MIYLKEISKAYGDKQVLRSFSHCFPDGEASCILGPSGCGKTTLMRIIAGLEAPDSGSIDGLEGKKISAVFQEDRLLENLSAEKNVLLTARPGFTRRDARALLACLGLEAECRRVQNFSGGMKRRTAIARALAADFDLLLLDEPFAGLDEALRRQVLTLIREELRGRTCIWITHFAEDAKLLGGSMLYLNEKQRII